MRILFLLFFSILFIVANAQEEKSETVKYLNKRGYFYKDSLRKNVIADTLSKWPDTLFYNTPYRAKLLGSPTIPISFSKVEAINGKYQVSPTVSIGYGYAWFFGKFIFNENDIITVQPTFFFGVIGDVGLQNDFSFQKLEGFFTGVFIGTTSFSLFGGYDYITHSGTIGIGGRIDLYTIHQSSLKPIGRVVEVRKHKSVSPPIKNE